MKGKEILLQDCINEVRKFHDAFLIGNLDQPTAIIDEKDFILRYRLMNEENQEYLDAAKNGNLNCLKYAHENGCPWNKDTCHYASQNGHLNCLKYAHENSCSWNEKTCRRAAYNGHLDCLKYAHENGCKWNKNTREYAAKNGHLDCLKYARDNGCC